MTASTRAAVRINEDAHAGRVDALKTGQIDHYTHRAHPDDVQLTLQQGRRDAIELPAEPQDHRVRAEVAADRKLTRADVLARGKSLIVDESKPGL